MLSFYSRFICWLIFGTPKTMTPCDCGNFKPSEGFLKNKCRNCDGLRPSMAVQKPRTPLRRTYLKRSVSPKTATGKAKGKKRTPAQLKKELDRLFSIYIRSKYHRRCYTCGKTEVTLQNGHFVSRSYLITRWDERNCRPQCVGCNLFGGGKPLDFEENLKRELGERVVEEMKASRHKIMKVSTVWYESEIERYKELLKDATL